MPTARHEDGFSRFYRRALAGQEGSWFTRLLDRITRPNRTDGPPSGLASPPAAGPTPESAEDRGR